MDSHTLLAVLTQLLLLVTGVQSNWCGPLVIYAKPTCKILQHSAYYELRQYPGGQYYITTYLENVTFTEAFAIGGNRLQNYMNGDNDATSVVSASVPVFIKPSDRGFIVGRYLPTSLPHPPRPKDPLIKLEVTEDSLRVASAPFQGSLALSNFAAHESALTSSCVAARISYIPNTAAFFSYLYSTSSLSIPYDVLEVQILCRA